MVPGKSDPRWKKIVTNTEALAFQSLATKMMMMRVKLLVTQDQSPAKIQEAIDVAYDFFTKNENVVVQDIKTLFG